MKTLSEIRIKKVYPSMEKNELRRTLDTWLAKVRDEYVRDVVGSVCIPSISVPQKGPYPYGKGCADMLDYMEAVVGKYGFEYENHEYQCATSLVKGSEGKSEIGLFGHMDVVSAGEGWSCEPFEGREQDGYIVGRGSNDNKGSTFACVYAMRFLKEHGIQLKNNVRLFYGCNEENGMKDAVYYGETRGFPDLTIVCDSWWPVSTAEKGTYFFDVSVAASGGNLKEFEVPNAESSVPSKCVCVLSGFPPDEVKSAAAGKEDIEVCGQGDDVKITAHGIGKHESFPEGSVNAVGVLAKFLLENRFVAGEEAHALRFVAESIEDYEGKALGVDFRDDFAGYTTHVLTGAKLRGGKLSLQYCIGFPAAPHVDKNEVGRILTEYFTRPFAEVRYSRCWEPHFVENDHPVVGIMCDNASKVLGETMKPFAQAGGTYTYVVDRSFASGPAIHGREQKLFPRPGHGGPHQPDECMEIALLLEGIKIYVLNLIDIDNWLAQEER